MELRYEGFLFSITDEDEFRNLVVWLEDQKIRWYKIEDRGELRDVKSSEWLKTLAKVVYITFRYFNKAQIATLMGCFISVIVKDKLKVAGNSSRYFPRLTV